MKLTREILKINPEKYTKKIEDFIREKMSELNRSGIVVPISGGLDSSVVATLCVRAVGSDKVTGLLLPEAETPYVSEKYALLLASKLKIKVEKRTITPYLIALEAFKGSLYWIPIASLRRSAAKFYLSRTKKNAARHSFSGKAPDYIKQSIANINLRQRIRLVETYKYAEPRNLMVAGSAHKTEDLVGLYVKFGIDDLSDIMPLKNLYRTQFLQIAEHIKVPKEILKRSPKPDIIPGVEDKYRDILGINSENLDIILFAFENKIKSDEISKQLKIPIQKIENIKSIIKSTEHMRKGVMAPEF